MKTDKEWSLGWRDIWANKICNFILRHLATKEYCAFVQVTTNLGLKELDKAVEEWANEKG